MKKKILLEFYKILEDLVNEFIKNYEGNEQLRTIDIVMNVFLRFVLDEIEN